MSPDTWFRANIVSIDNQTAHTVTIRLKPLDAWRSLISKPGQYVEVRTPHSRPHVYALASAPSDKTEIQLLMNKSSHTYEAIVQASEIDISAPRGGFTVAYEVNPSVFVATGTGIAPIRSLVREMFAKKASLKQSLLLYGARTEKDIPFQEELEHWADRGLHIHISLSRPHVDWPGFRGRIQEHIGRQIKDMKQVFACGQHELVRDLQTTLQREGLHHVDVRVNF